VRTIFEGFVKYLGGKLIKKIIATCTLTLLSLGYTYIRLLQDGPVTIGNLFLHWGLAVFIFGLIFLCGWVLASD